MLCFLNSDITWGKNVQVFFQLVHIDNAQFPCSHRITYNLTFFYIYSIKQHQLNEIELISLIYLFKYYTRKNLYYLKTKVLECRSMMRRGEEIRARVCTLIISRHHHLVFYFGWEVATEFSDKMKIKVFRSSPMIREKISAYTFTNVEISLVLVLIATVCLFCGLNMYDTTERTNDDPASLHYALHYIILNMYLQYNLIQQNNQVANKQTSKAKKSLVFFRFLSRTP